MGAIFHSSYTTASLFKTVDLNPPLSDLDAALTYVKTVLIHCDASLSWDSTAGILTWSEPIRIVAADDGDGKMFTNVIASGSVTLTTAQILFTDLTTVDGSTITATFISFATASTALIPKNRVILGVVNSSKLEFYPVKLLPSLSQMNNTGTTGVLVQHNVTATAAHVGVSGTTEDDIVLMSSVGLSKDSGRKLSEFLGAREATITCSAVATVDFSTAETQVMILTTNTKLALATAGINDGHEYKLRTVQDATGGWEVTWDTTVSTIHWRAGISTNTTNANYSAWYTFIRSQSTWYGDVVLNFAG